MKLKTRISKWILTLVGVATLNTPTALAASMSPILPLADHKSVSFLTDKALRDDDLTSAAPSDDGSAMQLATEVNELKRLGKKRTPAQNLRLVRALTMMSYFLSDVIHGHIESADKDQARSNLVEVRKSIGSVVDTAIKSKMPTTIEAQLEYLRAMARLSANQKLDDKTITKAKSLKGHAIQKLRLGLAMQSLNASRGNARSSLMNSLSAGSMKTPESSILVHLILAMDAAGLDSNLQKKHSTIPSYERHLRTGATKIRALSEADQARAQGTINRIWRTAEGNKIEWSRPPFDIKNSTDERLGFAIGERAALKSWERKDFASAIRNLDVIAIGLSGSPESLMFDERILIMKKAQFGKDQNAIPLDASLRRLTIKYDDQSVLGDGGEEKAGKAKVRFASEHRRFVQSELQSAKKPKTKSDVRARTIKIAQRFSDDAEDKNEKESVRAQIAEIYVLDRQYKLAVDILMDLALNGEPNRKVRHLKAAASAQSTLAKWPAKAPWDQAGRAPSSDKERLLDIYSQLSKDDASWHNTAHTGLLNIAMGNRDAAFQLWSAALEKTQANEHANRAAGLMMDTYAREKKWNELEAVSRLAMTHKLNALAGKKSISSHEMLGLALYEGGKSAMRSSDFKVAVTKLKEFTETYKSDKRRHDAVFVLAHAYHGNAQFPEALASLRMVVTQYPSSIHASESLYKGGFWSIESAKEDDAMFYHVKFLDRFGTESRASKVRASLVQVFEGRGMYADARSIYKQTLIAKGVANDKKLKAAVQMMLNEAKFGNEMRAASDADDVIKLAQGDAEALGLAYGVKVRFHAERGEFKKLGQIEAKLSSLDASNLSVSESLGASRYFMADHLSADAVKEIYNLEQTDPMGTLNRQFSNFQKMRGTFEGVCSAGESSFCAAAHHRIARIAESFVQSVEDLRINETLDPDSINAFKARKSSLVLSLAKISEDADEKALAISEKGQTMPEWTQQILWSSGTDGNFSQMTGKTGHAYIQYSPVMSSSTTETTEQSAEGN